MGILDSIKFLFSRRHHIYVLRRKYDRIREKAVRHSSNRLEALKILDQVEPTLVMLEEQNISAFERRRLAVYVTQGIRNAEYALKQNRQTRTKNLYNQRR